MVVANESTTGHPRFLWPKIPIIAQGKPRRGDDGRQWDTDACISDDQYGTMYQMLATQWVSKKELRDQAPWNIKQFYDALKKLLNENIAAVWFHRAGDVKSSYSEKNHFHIVIQPPLTEFQDTLARTMQYRTLKGKAEKAGFVCKTEQVRDLGCLVRYLAQLPRWYFGSNNRELGARIRIEALVDTPPPAIEDCVDSGDQENEAELAPAIEVMDVIDGLETPVWVRTKSVDPNANPYILGEMVTNENIYSLENATPELAPCASGMKRKRTLKESIEYVGGCFKKYGSNKIVECIGIAKRKEEHDDVHELEEMFSKPFSGQIELKAKQMLEYACADKETYFEKLVKECTASCVHQSGKAFLSIEQTHELFKDWCNDQNHKDPVLTMLQIYEILAQKSPKKNLLLVIGESNAGKSFWTRPLGFLDQYVGQITNDSHFMYANLCTSKLGIMNELRFSREQLEVFKNIAEGLSTEVPVKNSGTKRVFKQPIILTTNVAPWEAAPEMEVHIRNRAQVVSCPSVSGALAQHAKDNTNVDANPLYFVEQFKKLESFFDIEPFTTMYDESYTRYEIEDDTKEFLTQLLNF